MQVSKTGGWCIREGDHTDIGLANAIAGIVNGSSVASFGDGLGNLQFLHLFHIYSPPLHLNHKLQN